MRPSDISCEATSSTETAILEFLSAATRTGMVAPNPFEGIAIGLASANSALACSSPSRMDLTIEHSYGFLPIERTGVEPAWTLLEFAQLRRILGPQSGDPPSGRN